MTQALKNLEAESITILRETLAEFRNPVLLFSGGKDSAVVLHLLKKACAPARPRIPLMHIDTTWKFREMIEFRDRMARAAGMELIVHTNQDGVRQNVTPLTHDSTHYTHVMKTVALRQAIDAHKFDAVIGGARRDEEKSRAKERVFSLRSPTHVWDPKRQRPELWRLVNAAMAPGEHMRVFPISNWTELDVWAYIRQENIDLVPLYFAQKRSVVKRNGVWLMLDDNRMTVRDGEQVEERVVRFRTLGCYPLTAGVESDAATLDEVIAEVAASSLSERAGRLIDGDQDASMERKKREGYF